MRPDPEITRRAANLNTIVPHHLVIRPEQAMHVVAGAAKHRPVVATHSSTSDNGNFHGRNGTIKKALRQASECPGDKSNLLGAENRVLGGLGNAKLHNAFGGDLNRRAGGRVATD